MKRYKFLTEFVAFRIFPKSLHAQNKNPHARKTAVMQIVQIRFFFKKGLQS